MIDMPPPKIVCGSGRSGTTWLLDVLAEANGLRTIFEPLHPVAVPGAARHAYRCVPGDAVDEGLYEFFEDVFGGHLYSIWSDYRVRPDRLISDLGGILSLDGLKRCCGRWVKLAKHYRKYHPLVRNPASITKLIRANLMLGWLRRNFDARIAFLVRHPAAVVESKVRLGGDDWCATAMLSRYRSDESFMDVFGNRYSWLLDHISELSDIEAHGGVWCIENQAPLEQAKEHGYEVLFYERLAEMVEAEWDKAVIELGLDKKPDEKALRVPSEQTRSHLKRKVFDSAQHSTWVQRIGVSELRELEHVLKKAEVSAYTVDHPLPLL